MLIFCNYSVRGRILWSQPKLHKLTIKSDRPVIELQRLFSNGSAPLIKRLDPDLSRRNVDRVERSRGACRVEVDLESKQGGAVLGFMKEVDLGTDANCGGVRLTKSVIPVREVDNTFHKHFAGNESVNRRTTKIREGIGHVHLLKSEEEMSVSTATQEKEDPHDPAVFVANLPPSLSQREYERILLKLLSAQEKPLIEIGPFLKLHYAMYEEKKLIVLCLPNVQQHMIPPDVEPLLVLVNVKNGGCQGTELLSAFRRLLNPFQVFDVLEEGGPLVGLYVFNISKYRFLAAGGDGTVGWVLHNYLGGDGNCGNYY